MALNIDLTKIAVPDFNPMLEPEKYADWADKMAKTYGSDQNKYIQSYVSAVTGASPYQLATSYNTARGTNLEGLKELGLSNAGIAGNRSVYTDWWSNPNNRYASVDPGDAAKFVAGLYEKAEAPAAAVDDQTQNPTGDQTQNPTGSQTQNPTGDTSGTAGLLGQPSAAISGNTENYVAPEGASVSEGLLNLIDKANPLAQRSITQARQAANARGLLNSTLAESAGYANWLDKAAELANADAANFTQLYSQERAGELDSALSSQEAAQQGWLYNVQGAISASLSRLDAAQQLNLQTTLKGMDYAQQERMAKLDASIQAKLAQEEARLKGVLSAQEAKQAVDQMREQLYTEYTNELGRIEAENTFEQILLDQKISLEDRTNMSTMLDSIKADYQAKRMEYLLNTNFETPEDRQAALDGLAQDTESRIRDLAATYGVELSWDPYADDVTGSGGTGETNNPFGSEGNTNDNQGGATP